MTVVEMVAVVKALLQWMKQEYPFLWQWAKEGQMKAIQAWFEENFSKPEKVNWIIQRKLVNGPLGSAIEQVAQSRNMNLKLVHRALAEVILHRRRSVEELANMLKHKVDSVPELFGFIDALSDSGLLDRKGNLLIVKDPKDIGGISMALTKSEELELDLFQSNPPMVCKPKRLYVSKDGKNIRGGYLKVNQTVFCKKADRHTEVPLDFLNQANQIKYRINYKYWFGYGMFHPEIPERDINESDDLYSKKVQGAERKHLLKMFFIQLYHSLGIDFIWILKKLDSRARNYVFEYLFNPQGTDVDKALLCLPGEYLNKEGERYFKESIACMFNAKVNGRSIDKSSFTTRVEFYEKEFASLMSLPKEFFYKKLEVLCIDAECPHMFWGQMDNMYRIINNGAKCWSVHHSDATSSGYQLQAIFARDWETAKEVNVIWSGEEGCRDLYTKIYSWLVSAGIPTGFTREQVKKKVLIPAIYNSTSCVMELFGKKSYEDIFYEVMNRLPMWKLNRCFPSLWNDKWEEYFFYLPDGMKVYKKIWETVSVEVPYGDSTVTLHFRVNRPRKYSLELGPNITHACDGFIAREKTRAFSFNKRKIQRIKWLMAHPSEWKFSKPKEVEKMEKLLHLGKNFEFYSLAILTQLNEYNIAVVPQSILTSLLKEVNDYTDVMEIHDSFGVHPNYTGQLRKTYRVLLAKLAKSRYLPAVIDYLKGNPEGTTGNIPVSDEIIELILKSEYALC